MNKKLLFFSLFILLISITIFGKCIYEYHNSNKNVDNYVKKIEKIENNIKSIKKEINNKEIENEKAKNDSDIEKIGVLEVWEKELEKIKKSS